MAQPKIKRAWVTNQNLSFVAALTFSSPSLGPVVCERACRTSGFLEIFSAVSAVAIYCKFAPRDPFDCRGRQDSEEASAAPVIPSVVEESRCESLAVTPRIPRLELGMTVFFMRS